MPSALIQERGTVSGNQMRMKRLIEDAAQTFLTGTPVQLNTANGAVQAWAGTTVTNGILGIAKEFGVGLTTAGAPLGLPSGTAGLMPPLAGGPTFPSGAQSGVPNEPLAHSFLRPVFNDGRTGVVLAIPDTMFYGQIGSAQAAPTNADIGKIMGLTIDTDGHWFVDRTKSVAGTSACVEIVGLDQWDKTRGVLFTFLSGVGQVPA